MVGEKGVVAFFFANGGGGAVTGEKARVIWQGQKSFSDGIVQPGPGRIGAPHRTGEDSITRENRVMDFIRNSASGVTRCEKNFYI